MHFLHMWALVAILSYASCQPLNQQPAGLPVSSFYQQAPLSSAQASNFQQLQQPQHQLQQQHAFQPQQQQQQRLVQQPQQANFAPYPSQQSNFVPANQQSHYLQTAQQSGYVPVQQQQSSFAPIQQQQQQFPAVHQQSAFAPNSYVQPSQQNGFAAPFGSAGNINSASAFQQQVPQQYVASAQPSQQVQGFSSASAVVNSARPEGTYAFGYQTPEGQSRAETVLTDGATKGSYTYSTPEGQTISIHYTSGKNGFQTYPNANSQATNAGSFANSAAVQQQQPQIQQQQQYAAPSVLGQPQQDFGQSAMHLPVSSSNSGSRYVVYAPLPQYNLPSYYPFGGGLGDMQQAHQTQLQPQQQDLTFPLLQDQFQQQPQQQQLDFQQQLAAAPILTVDQLQSGSEPVTQVVPQNSPQTVPQATPQAVPQAGPPATPPAAPQSTPQAAPEQPPQGTASVPTSAAPAAFNPQAMQQLQRLLLSK